jgi:hypothetical protein
VLALKTNAHFSKLHILYFSSEPLLQHFSLAR